MEKNALVIVFVAIAILALIIFVIKRNRKDQKSLENELNRKDIRPDKHDEEHI